MLKKIAAAASGLILLLTPVLAAGCDDERDFDAEFADRIKVVYELEGGKYLNSRTSVSHYYEFAENAARTIKPLEDADFSKDGVTKDGGFVLEGWYTTKTVENGTAVYSGKWNFETDTVPDGGITLYAKWKSPIRYTFDFVYTDENGEEKTANSLEVNEGDRFGDVYKRDILSYAEGYDGHTAIAVYNDPERTIPFDDSIVHPGGEQSTAVKLYVEYIEGTYTIVRNASQLRLARSKNIYLLDDIDMEGAKLSFDNYNGKTFMGNGHSISNFSVDFEISRNDLVEDFTDDSKKSLSVALFGNLQNATVKDVTFTGVKIEVDTFFTDIYKIYVSPLAGIAEGCTFENVTFGGTFEFSAVTVESFGIEAVTDRGAYDMRDSTQTGCVYEVSVIKKTA